MNELTTPPEGAIIPCSTVEGKPVARALRDTNYSTYLTLAARFKRDVERMSPRARRYYLYHHLRLVEMQIRLLSDRLGADEAYPPRHVSYTADALDSETVTSWDNLSYLMATRDALRETLDALARGGVA
jgi:hypothetical protein